jgi:hypothetical protein
MKKLSTGEPYAGKPHVRFGGRGSVKTFPTPIKEIAALVGVAPMNKESGAYKGQ